MNYYIIVVVIVIIFIVWALCKTKDEKFNIPVRSSSAWDWNVGPGYGAGYGTGYAMWGIWPGNLPKEPWKNWMWKRRPLIFVSPYTPVPQIDYNNAGYDEKPTSEYKVSILWNGKNYSLAVNGVPEATLQLDRNRTYYFNVYTPGMPFIFSLNGHTPYLTKPIEQGLIPVTFDNTAPDHLYYTTTDKSNTGGHIFLNPLKN